MVLPITEVYNTCRFMSVTCLFLVSTQDQEIDADTSRLVSNDVFSYSLND